MEFAGIEGIGENGPLVIAGPCSAESESQVLRTATQLRDVGVRIYRAGIWKPRTKPGGFEGIGKAGLEWLQRVKREVGLYVTTEVATKEHVEASLSAGVDMLWIGARTTVNPFAVQEIADALRGVDIPVLVKNPVNPDLELWIGAIERLYGAGLRRLGAIHRGFSTYEQKVYRNIPLWHIAIEMRRRLPGLPLICDPSHIGGKRELVGPLSQQALDMGYEGLMIESHEDPGSAWSDASQQVTPEALGVLLGGLVVREELQTTEGLSELRKQIDEIDEELLVLLSKRMRVSREIGVYKKEHNMAVVHSGRYQELLEARSLSGQAMGLSGEFVRELLRGIHEESVRQQTEILSGQAMR
ncbi:MAG: bifunctional 3-deoxy-7-phosphoheptulonate synthase/chorismate mutase type II [Tannerellaceae bacterium]|jgi:chorismate mutase|nr:bifunctional 3-deoxy-7-phosphoheptulonate synthase/chorismate mutase type II [Tannerellaceae bacterium]